MTRRAALAIGVLLAGVTAVWASGATFVIMGTGITLKETKTVEEGGKEVQRFEAKAGKGKAFTLSAQGIVLPRGGKEQPGEPDSGAWTFDEKRFKKLAAEGAADKTKITLRLEPTMAGPARVQFNGKILGYKRTFEIMIDVME